MIVSGTWTSRICLICGSRGPPIGALFLLARALQRGEAARARAIVAERAVDGQLAAAPLVALAIALGRAAGRRIVARGRDTAGQRALFLRPARGGGTRRRRLRLGFGRRLGLRLGDIGTRDRREAARRGHRRIAAQFQDRCRGGRRGRLGRRRGGLSVGRCRRSCRRRAAFGLPPSVLPTAMRGRPRSRGRRPWRPRVRPSHRRAQVSPLARRRPGRPLRGRQPVRARPPRWGQALLPRAYSLRRDAFRLPPPRRVRRPHDGALLPAPASAALRLRAAAWSGVPARTDCPSARAGARAQVRGRRRVRARAAAARPRRRRARIRPGAARGGAWFPRSPYSNGRG